MDQHDRPPGTPHVIRWRSPDEATIEVDGVVLAVVSVGLDTPYDLEVLREPATPQEKDDLARAVTWAVEEFERRRASEGVAGA